MTRNNFEVDLGVFGVCDMFYVSHLQSVRIQGMEVSNRKQAGRTPEVSSQSTVCVFV